MRSLTLLICCLASIASKAADSTGSNRVHFSMIPIYQFSKEFDIINDKTAPETIRIKNTLGFQTGFEYERTTRYGLIFNTGIFFGVKKYDITISQDLSNFDPAAVNNLKGAIYTDRIELSLPFIRHRFMMGYKAKINNGYSILAKVGWAWKFNLDGYDNTELPAIEYRLDNQNVTNVERFMVSEVMIGNSKDRRKRGNYNTIYNQPQPTYELYLGIERKLSRKWVKNFSIGLEANRTFNWNQGGGFIFVTSKTKTGQFDNYSLDRYKEQNVSVGLRLAVGLWK